MGGVGRGVRRGGTPCAAAPPPLRSAPTARGGRGRLSCAVGEQAQPLRRAERGTGQRGARRGKAGLRGDGQRWTRRAEGGMALCGGNPPLRSAPRRGTERASRTTRRAEGESGTARGDGQRWARRAERGNALCGGTPPLRSAPTARGGRGRLSCAVGEQAQPLRRAERGTGQRGARRGKAGLRAGRAARARRLTRRAAAFIIDRKDMCGDGDDGRIRRAPAPQEQARRRSRTA